MTAPRARLSRGKPRVPLRDHPFRLLLACIDVLHAAGNIPRQKATLLMTTLFFAESAEPIPPADLPEKLRRAFEQYGGTPMSYTMPASHTRTADNIKPRQQRIDTLNKLDKRYASGTRSQI
jgi:hypothetical protein